MDTLATLIILLAVLFYFLPTWIVMVRKPQHPNTIEIINLLFGWTVLGWIAALIWAIVETPRVYKRA